MSPGIDLLGEGSGAEGKLIGDITERLENFVTELEFCPFSLGLSALPFWPGTALVKDCFDYVCKQYACILQTK